ncbi:hypothetical protein RYX56_05670 [Alkalihalophilus lindianensis]|uniref:Uncharacterized protein n=1 Tax=Alkalihalophilus lindianensis TaxID=1630542 RepID=A0ABU3X7C2_9BACI|nr:hypothetical protein [Alkalihalophilus lindianensis]MDV2683797.1 hypothetical protein [Alkalihalophilus lindianensis]MDV2683863.1 hypothetical protein [Alkalihalophilus lindianensis]
MKVAIENGKVVPAINYLYGLKLVRKQSRIRRDFIKLLDERAKKVDEDRKEIAKEHSHKDEKGEAVVKNGNFDIKDLEAFREDVKELNEEELILEGGEHRGLIRTMKQILAKFEEDEYEGQTSEIYDYLYEAFEVDQVESETEKGAE